MKDGNGASPRCWLLLRGLGRESGHWGDFPDRLQAALAPDRVLTIDLPGNGSLHALPSPVSVAAMTEHCRATLRARCEAGPVHLLSLSLGAMVAVDWASRHADEVAAAVLISTSLRGLSPWRQRLRPAALAQLLAALLWPGTRWREAQILRLTSSRRPPPPAVLAHWCALALHHPVRRLNLLRQLLAAARFVAPASGPLQPLLVLAGAGDRLVDPACSLRIAQAWHCASALHPSAGHDLPLDDADWVMVQLKAWINTLHAA